MIYFLFFYSYVSIAHFRLYCPPHGVIFPYCILTDYQSYIPGHCFPLYYILILVIASAASVASFSFSFSFCGMVMCAVWVCLFLFCNYIFFPRCVSLYLGPFVGCVTGGRVFLLGPPSTPFDQSLYFSFSLPATHVPFCFRQTYLLCTCLHQRF